VPPLFVLVQETLQRVPVQGVKLVASRPMSVVANLPHRLIAVTVTTDTATSRLPFAIARALIRAPAGTAT
jgi:hypothetical protein